MAMTTCPECGKNISDTAAACPNCGHQIKELAVTEDRFKAPLSLLRLVLGIFSILLFCIITFQSCAVGISNALEENNALSGSAGLITAILGLVAGIIGIATKNAKKGTGAFVAFVFYILAALCTIGQGDTYGDLVVWRVVFIIFGIIFLLAGILTNKKRKAA